MFPPRKARLAFVAIITAAFLQAHADSLPSGLSPVSQVTVAGTQLEIDGNGTLYRSDDQGKHWHAVKQQWQGKAIEPLGMPALTDHQTVAVLLKSTSALHWVSVDRGKTWKPSTLDDVRRNDVHWS